MAERIIFQEWRKSIESTKYPFSSRATLVNADGRVILDGSWLDAAIYPIGAVAGLYLASVEVTHEEVILSVGDGTLTVVATGAFTLVNPPDNVVLTDAGGRPAGILVSESARLGIFQSWGVGTHNFTPEQTEFAATVCFPTPEVGVRGIALEDGSVFVGDVWLVGEDGVVLRPEEVDLPGNPTQRVTVIRVDVVGDPLFRRRLCTPTDLFSTPRLVKKLRVVGPNREFDCLPDASGNINLTAANDLAADTVLRINTTPEGIVVSAVGSRR